MPIILFTNLLSFGYQVGRFRASRSFACIEPALSFSGRPPYGDFSGWLLCTQRLPETGIIWMTAGYAFTTIFLKVTHCGDRCELSSEK